ncbi:MAG: YkvA family protein [Limnochordia bacterium]
MRCLNCGQKIALAKVCPYCGRRARPAESSDEETTKEQTSRVEGVFKGRVSRQETRGSEGVFGILPAVIRYFSDPGIPQWRKAAILLGVLYVISPIDVLPGAIYPLLGWLDDAAVAAFTWRLLRSELARHDKNP